MTTNKSAVIQQPANAVGPVDTSVVATSQGAHARLSAASPDTLQVFDASQQLIFEYDAAAGVTRMQVPEGDLELATHKGSIRLKAADEVAIAGKDVNVHATESLALKVIDISKQLLRPMGSTLSLLPHKAMLAAQSLELGADDAKVSATRMAYRGQELSAVVERASSLFEKLDTKAKRILQTSDHLITKVKDAAQLRAGRINQQVEGTIQIKSEKAVHKTKKDFKVQAERIHLG
ncbi:MAG: hypothetical protein CSA49_04820 [Gammaproteobacteria bacterium]|nr:MAG: hypothetical protein CSA49_04820 [Gammaproteobacteria bacterium]